MDLNHLREILDQPLSDQHYKATNPNNKTIFYSDYRKRWRDVISQHPGHFHGYKSVMAALLKVNIHYGLFPQMTQNAQIFKSFVV